MANPTIPPSINDDEVIRLASSRCPAPQERATKAVVPTPMAISNACKEKNTRWPAPSAASEAAPRSPTNLVCTIATKENRRLEAIAGMASCQMVRRLCTAGWAAAASMVVNLTRAQISRATGFLNQNVSTE
jgi:hypothetical protein